MMQKIFTVNLFNKKSETDNASGYIGSKENENLIEKSILARKKERLIAGTLFGIYLFIFLMAYLIE